MIKKGSGGPNEEYGGASVLLYSMSNLSSEKRFPIVKALLIRGADINYSAYYNKTDFTNDRSRNSEDEIKLKTAFHPSNIVSGPLVNHLVAYEYYEITEEELGQWKNLLKKYIFDPNIIDMQQNTSLHYAVIESLRRDRLNKMIPFLVRNGAKCEILNKAGMTAIQVIKARGSQALKTEFKKYCK